MTKRQKLIMVIPCLVLLLCILLPIFIYLFPNSNVESTTALEQIFESVSDNFPEAHIKEANYNEIYLYDNEDKSNIKIYNTGNNINGFTIIFKNSLDNKEKEKILDTFTPLVISKWRDKNTEDFISKANPILEIDEWRVSGFVTEDDEMLIDGFM